MKAPIKYSISSFQRLVMAVDVMFAGGNSLAVAGMCHYAWRLGCRVPLEIHLHLLVCPRHTQIGKNTFITTMRAALEALSSVLLAFNCSVGSFSLGRGYSLLFLVSAFWA